MAAVYGVPQGFLLQKELPAPANLNRQQMDVYLWHDPILTISRECGHSTWVIR